MNAPSRMKKIVAFPPVALGVVLLCGLLVWNWYQGNTPWLVGVFAIAFALQTFSAIGEVQRYKTWRKAWNAMSDPDGTSAPPRKGKFLVPFVLIVVLAFAVQIPSIRSNSGAIIAVSLTAAFFVLIIGFIQKRRRHTKQKASSMPVTWLIGRPGSSPSRSDAILTLPEYSARILSRSGAIANE